MRKTCLKVDLSERIRKVTHLGTGTLYGVVEEFPSDEMLQAIRPMVVGSSPEAGHQQLLGAAIPVAKRIRNYGGRVQIRLAEWLPHWPYEFRGMEDWLEKLKLIVENVKKEEITNIDGYELWNEPDGTWLGEYIVPVDEVEDYSLTFRNVYVEADGNYVVTIRYASGESNDITAKVSVDKSNEKVVRFPSTGGWFRAGAFGNVSFEVKLKKGNNSIKIQRDSAGYLEYDFLEVKEANPRRYQAELATPRKNAVVVTNGYASSSKTDGLTFEEFFSSSQKELKKLDSAAKTIGPSYCVYTHRGMENFLKYQKENGTIPDIICWHQLSDDDFTATFRDYRRLEKKIKIDPLPISINEYSGGGWFEEEGMPGTNAPLIAKFERLGIDSACQTYWNSNQGFLSSSLTENSKPNGGFWFFKWYADMSGQMVLTVPEQENNPRWLDGFACIDEVGKSASIIFGGESTGSAELSIEGIPECFGENINVQIEQTIFPDRFVEEKSAKILEQNIYKIKDGKIIISLNSINSRDGYRVYLYKS